MKRKINSKLYLNFLIFLFIITQALPAQQVDINLPALRGKTMTLALKYGTQSDTVYNAPLDSNGHAQVILPGHARGYRGMATLKSGDYAVFDFIVAGEDFALSCTEEYPHGGNVTFSGSPENSWLQMRFVSQQKRMEKLGLLGEALRLYGKDEALRPVLEQEAALLKTAQASFEDSLKTSPLYAAKFLRYYNYLNREVGGLLLGDSLQMAHVRTSVRDSLDVNGLFTSGLWFGTLNGLLALYDNGTPYHKDFIIDMSRLLGRCEGRAYHTLAENLFTICERMGWNDLEEQLAYFLINDGRIKEPEGKLKMLMTLFKLGRGSKVPALSFGVFPKGKVLLVFYESGCNACDNEIGQLKGNYPLLREKGYEVVSVAADKDARVFGDTSASFPWKARYCNLEGFSGPDFKNFGVIGTPTFYVIDERGVLQGRYARLVDTKLLNNANQ